MAGAAKIASAPGQRALIAVATATALALALSGTEAASASIDLESPDLGVRFAVPAYCSAIEGPGTIEAVCDPSGDAARSATAQAATALKLEIVMLPTPADAGQPIEILVTRYGFGHFQEDVPAAVCGAETRVKIEDAVQIFEGGRVVYTASVLCPEIRFLGLGARRAVVRAIVGPGRRYQVFARALEADFQRLKPEIDAFLASLRIEPEKSP
jgi:hypothetical protein